MIIDVGRLRKDLISDSYAGAFAFMPAMIVEAFDIENASNEELIKLALSKGVDLSKYEVKE